MNQSTYTVQQEIMFQDVLKCFFNLTHNANLTHELVDYPTNVILEVFYLSFTKKKRTVFFFLSCVIIISKLSYPKKGMSVLL